MATRKFCDRCGVGEEYDENGFPTNKFWYIPSGPFYGSLDLCSTCYESYGVLIQKLAKLFDEWYITK